MEKSQLLLYPDFLNSIQKQKKTEEKIRLCLDFMHKAISQEKIPAFRDFWEAKKLCLELFKEKIPSYTRSIFWKEYLELSREIRKLKEILDEQSLYAQEQIALAVNAIEKELSRGEEFQGELDLLEVPSIVKHNALSYREIQRELDLLNTFAGKLNALRKELIQVHMRLKQKNQFFQQLSQLGDQVFPKRKEYIKRISDLFMQDVKEFAAIRVIPPYFERKEQIKALQNFAKELTISTQTFSETREILSHCWDILKGQEKEEKKQSKEGLEKIIPKIAAFQEECKKAEVSFSQAEEKIASFFKEMKELKLGYEEIKTVRRQLLEIRKDLEEKEKNRKIEEKRILELERKKQEETIKDLLGSLQKFLDQAEGLTHDALVEKWEALVKEGKGLSNIGIERELFENRLDAIVDHIQEKKWQNLLGNSLESSEEIVSSLHSLLDERHKKRQKLKESIEIHRRAVGSSSLSVKESMLYQELLSEERLRLDFIETMIEEIEEKLFDLEG